jgi:hypothetical protein
LPAGRPDPVSCFIVVTGRSLERGS